MKRILSLIALMVLLSFSASADRVDTEQAAERARAFLSARQSTARQVRLASVARRVKAVTDMGYYYIFNIGDGNGFVIVSGDDRTMPVLGYSDTGRFDPARVPANMQAWLQGYADQIRALDAMSAADAAAALSGPRRANVVDTRNSIAPMISTRWDQAAPYWNKCPEFMPEGAVEGDAGELAFTGCVATSIAQIMKYHNWPERTTREIPAYTFSYSLGNYNYGTVNMPALPVTDFDWAHMSDSYTGAEDSVYTNAVATLMFYAGCAVKSQYGVNSTGAFTDDIPKAFTDYFAYDRSTIQIKFRTDFTQANWDNMVYAELAAGRPMIYNGTAGSGGGHSFVCDGYEFGNYFHINWGWGGMGNGFFQLAVLNPRESGIGGSSSAEGYNMKQNIIIGIQPGDPITPGPDPVVEDALSATGLALGFSGSIERDNQNVGFSIYKRKTFNLNYADHVGTQKRYDIGLALYDTDRNFIEMIINRGVYATALTSALGSYHSFGSDIEARDAVKFGKGRTGRYLIVPMYCLQGSDQWKPMLETDRFYYEANLTATTATFTVHPIVDLQATDWQFSGGEKVGSQEQVTVTLHNNSADRFFGNLYLWFGNQQIDEFAGYTTSIQAEVLAGEDAQVTFNLTPENAGTQQLRITTDEQGNHPVAGTTSVNIAQSSTSTMNLTVDIKADNAINGVIYNNHARFKVDITNNGEGEYNKYVLAPLFLVEKDALGNVTGGDMVTYKQSTLSLQPGQTATLYFDFDNLGYGSTYSLNIYARDENNELKNLVPRGASVYYDIDYGVVCYDGGSLVGSGMPASESVTIPDNALAVRLEGLDISHVTPNANPNTIYLLGEKQPTPEGLDGRNIVRGNTAERITLKDGYGYFTPQRINAATISYERAFAQTGKWSTIVLPFAPVTVTAGGEKVETGNSLLLMTFAHEVGDSVCFENSARLEANVPYIIALNSENPPRERTIMFSAENATLMPEPIAYTSGKTYLMAGTFIKQELPTIYTINGEGTRFVLPETAALLAVEPFRAYFSALVPLEQNPDIVLPELKMPALTGDVNLDGSVDVSDLSILINLIINLPYDGQLGVTDLNNDGRIDVSDISMLIDIIIGKR